MKPIIAARMCELSSLQIKPVFSGFEAQVMCAFPSDNDILFVSTYLND